MSYDKWSEASVLKTRGWVEESSPKAFCPDIQSSWDEAKGRFRVHGAGRLWACPAGTLTRHPPHKAYDSALATVSCVSRERLHFILTAHFP